MVQRRWWFWALLGALFCVLMGTIGISTCLFMSAPRFDRTDPNPTLVSSVSALPHVPPQLEPDFIGARLPADIQWVLEIRDLRTLGLNLADEELSFDSVSVPEPWSGTWNSVIDSAPFDLRNPLEWIRSGYDLARPWAIAWYRENRDDSGAWVVFVPVRNEPVAEETTRAWLRAWDSSDGRVAWIPGAAYQQIAIEVGEGSSPNDRLQQLSDSTTMNALADGTPMQTLVQALGGEWSLRLRFRNSGAGELYRLFGENSSVPAWPISRIDPDAHMGMALRVQRNHQRLRLALTGPHLTRVRLEAGFDPDPNGHRIFPSEDLPRTLSIGDEWWDSLRDADSQVRTSVDELGVVAEMGPLGLVVDLRRTGGLQTWEPMISWWTERL